MGTRSATRRLVALGVVALALAAACSTSQVKQTPPKPPRPVTPPTGAIWTGDLETGDLSQFQSDPNDQDFLQATAADVPSVVTEPTRLGKYAMSVTIPAGASTDDFGARSEAVPPVDYFRPGDDYFIAFSQYLAEGFPVDNSSDDWQVVGQVKSTIDGSPPIEFDVEEGKYRLSGGDGRPDGGEKFEAELGPAQTGVWVDWVLHVKFSDDPEVGFIEVWRDGEKVLDKMNPPGGTMYPDDDGEGPRGYAKFGYYRKSGISAAGTVLYDEMRIGPSYDSVALRER